MTQHIVFLDRASVPEHIEISPPSFDHTWTNFDNSVGEEIINRAKNADIIITNKVPLSANAIEQLPKLKHIAVYATGYNIIDIEACLQRDIVVTNTPNYSAKAIAEHALALILALRRHLMAYRDSVFNGAWNHSDFFHGYLAQTFDLEGARLGIIGGGNSGKAMAKLGNAVGMETFFADRKGLNRSTRANYLSFNEVISNSDVISIHCPLTEDTKDLITLDELSAMKKNALLINTARGGIVNENDLVTAVQRGLIAGAGFDVASVEPITADNPLLILKDLPNFILTPHVAWTSEKSLNLQANILTANIEQYYLGKPINRVDLVN
jgi:glycerate dehydrogenase